MSKIQLTDSLQEVVFKMSEGNPGAISILMQLLNNPQVCEPANPFMVILTLDSYEIYGSNIWIMYKDLCGEDIEIFETLFRHIQMGIMPLEVLKKHINESKPFDNLYTRDELFNNIDNLEKIKE